ncbi:MAG: cell division protein ZapA [Vicinamibacteria bacterium]|nr:cell division protein ZapA [Vicinamibacteria bacterium]
MGETLNTVQVEIFGQVYAIKAEADPAQVEEVASRVDSEMRALSRSIGVVDSLRIAVLAALNIADECVRLRAEVRRLEERATALSGEIEDIL